MQEKKNETIVLASYPVCMNCSVSHPEVLQFQHRKEAGKKMAIPALVSRASSLKRITNEIKKCDVLCANCHAKRHWRVIRATDSWEVIVGFE